jgi:hypothetical protein
MELIEMDRLGRYLTPLPGYINPRRWVAPEVASSHLQDSLTDVTERKSEGTIKRQDGSREEWEGFRWN